MNKEKKIYLAYRPFYAANGTIIKPGTYVSCTKIEAMCINTMQPMTLRETNDNRQSRASDSDGDI